MPACNGLRVRDFPVYVWPQTRRLGQVPRIKFIPSQARVTALIGRIEAPITSVVGIQQDAIHGVKHAFPACFDVLEGSTGIPDKAWDRGHRAAAKVHCVNPESWRSRSRMRPILE